jgi:hypothetical protein
MLKKEKSSLTRERLRCNLFDHVLVRDTTIRVHVLFDQPSRHRWGSFLTFLMTQGDALLDI